MTTTQSIYAYMQGANLADRVDRLMLADRLEENGMEREGKIVRECYIAIFCLAESIQIEGNASAIDEDTDSEIAERIHAQLDAGNEWAWCTVGVEARWIDDEPAHMIYKGRDYLGCCSYANKEDFMQCEYYSDMVAKAIVRLIEEATSK